ncbi:hypothetical protein DSM117340_01388 [Lentibacter algarum]
MANKTEVALRKQLVRELEHKAWLFKHLQGTVQLSQCHKRILILRTKLTRETVTLSKEILLL